jgi:hypothetical protein
MVNETDGGFWSTSWLFGENPKGTRTPSKDEGAGSGGGDDEEGGGDMSLPEEVRTAMEAVRSFLPRGFRVAEASVRGAVGTVNVSFPSGNGDALKLKLEEALPDGWELAEIDVREESPGGEWWTYAVLESSTLGVEVETAEDDAGLPSPTRERGRRERG